MTTRIPIQELRSLREDILRTIHRDLEQKVQHLERALRHMMMHMHSQEGRMMLEKILKEIENEGSVTQLAEIASNEEIMKHLLHRYYRIMMHIAKHLEHIVQMARRFGFKMPKLESIMERIMSHLTERNRGRPIPS